jgi:hypothetical protein
MDKDFMLCIMLVRYVYGFLWTETRRACGSVSLLTASCLYFPNHGPSVRYTVDGFVEKNTETMSEELGELGDESTMFL